jgi:aldehyde:ferredoxin oxidoreductase
MSDYRVKLLEVDLTTRTSKVHDVTDNARLFLGGNGLGSRLLWDMVPQGTDPLSPENILHIGTGPITGLVGCKTSISFKSPLTGLGGEASISAIWR